MGQSISANIPRRRLVLCLPQQVKTKVDRRRITLDSQQDLGLVRQSDAKPEKRAAQACSRVYCVYVAPLGSSGGLGTADKRCQAWRHHAPSWRQTVILRFHDPLFLVKSFRIALWLRHIASTTKLCRLLGSTTGINLRML